MDQLGIAIACYISQVADPDYRKLHAQRVLANALAQQNLLISSQTVSDRIKLDESNLIEYSVTGK